MTLQPLITLGVPRLGDDPASPQPRLKTLILLAYLARHPTSQHHRTGLATLLWGDRSDARARQSLRQALSELRTLVPDGALETAGETVTFDARSITLDVARFEALSSAGSAEDAVALWHGDFLAGTDDRLPEAAQEWLRVERAALRQRLARCHEQLTASARQHGDFRAWRDRARAWLAALPLDERAATTLIEACRTEGNEAEASAVHAAFVERVARDAGDAPSPGFLRLGIVADSTTTQPDEPREPVLVERDSLLRELEAAWVRVVAGNGQGVVLRGAAGSGKSRVVSELAQRARATTRDASVALVSAVGGTPLSLLRDVLSPLVTAPGVRAAPPEAIATLAGFVPSFADHFPHHRRPPGASPTEAAVRVVTDIGTEGPLLIVIDDAAAADAQSREALVELLRRPPPHLLLVLTTSEREASDTFLAGMAARTPTHDVPPLGRGGVRRLVQGMLPTPDGDGAGLADQLFDLTGGNPGLVTHAVRQLVRDGVCRPQADGRWLVSQDPTRCVDQAVRRPVELRLATLSGAARRVVHVVAVAGVVDNATVEHAAALPASEFARARAEAVAQGWMDPQTPELRIAGDSVRRAICDQMAPSEGRQWQGAIANALAPMRGASGRGSVQRESAGRVGMRRTGTWGAMLATVVVATIALASMRHPRRPELQAGTALVLADVEATGSDSMLAGAIHAGAEVALGASPHLALVPASQVHAALGRMGRSRESAVLTGALAREVALRESAPAVIEFRLGRVDTTWVVGANLVDPVSAQTLWSGQRAVSQRAAVLDAVQALSLQLRQAVGERVVGPVASDSLPRVTTRSLEALKHFADGRRAWSRGQLESAAESWRRAVALDTSFAMALASLAVYQVTWANDREQARAWLERAWQHRDHLTEPERLRLEIVRESHTGDPRRAATLSRALAERFPSAETWASLGKALQRMERCEEAVDAFTRSLRLDSMRAGPWIDRATCLQFLARYADAVRDYQHAERLDTTSVQWAWLAHEYGRALLAADREGEAVAVFRRKAGAVDHRERARGLRSLGLVEMAQGRATSAMARFDSARALIAGEQMHLTEIREHLLAIEAARLGGDPEREGYHRQRAMDLAEDASLAPNNLLFLGSAAARAGDHATAARLLVRLERSMSPANAADVAARAALRAEVALARGNPGQALAALDGVAMRWPTYQLNARLRALEQLGRLADARHVAQTLASGFHWGNEGQSDWILAPLDEARLAAREGDLAGARATLSAFVKRMARADSTLPALLQARRELARMQARSG